ncbi:MAG TPA: thrombospondin type 3 repeat-containing protein [Thermohalobaculum sp.]|nr:thrombospondin type 3 repeat-containing protein [Thermohalobaculum sp.]
MASKNVVGFGANATGQLFDVLLFNVLPAGLPPEPRFTGHFHGGGNDTIGATTRFFSANDVTVGTISYDGAAVRTYQHNAAASGLLVAKSIALNTGDGAFRVGGGVYPNYNLFVGHIAEVLVYSEVLSDADREAVEAYLFTKYTVVTVDTDGDGVADDVDNCVDDANPAQANNDGDAEGDVCDLDDDNDGTVDTADNCPVDANFDQADFDGDGLGNVCDPTFVAGETVAEIEGLSKVIRDAVAAANPPGGNGMVAKILGKGGVLAKVSNAVDRFNFGLIDAATYVAELQDALDKLDAFDNQLAAKIGNGQIADPEATALEDASVAIRAIIDDLIFNAGF